MATEKEIRQRRKAEQLRRKRQQRKMAVFVVLLIAILLGVLGFMSCNKNKDSSGESRNDAVTDLNGENPDGEDSEGENQSHNDSVSDSADGEDGSDAQSGDGQAATPTPEAEMINLSETQKYTGNLILVNSNYEYHFEENAYELMLQDVASYGGGIPVGESGIQLAARIMEPLYQMIQDCNTALSCSDTGVTSAYRSKEEQQQIYSDYAAEYGQWYAEAYVANPGYSEHHTGLAMDMGIYYANGGVDSFSESDNAVWMNDNCQNYGFIRRYKEDKVDITGINNESWHFRYVGIPHATYMNQQNLCLEEYIEFLRTQTSVDNPLTVECVSGTYEIYATREMAIPKPEGEYTVEGDNIDGYIVTSLVSQ